MAWGAANWGRSRRVLMWRFIFALLLGARHENALFRYAAILEHHLGLVAPIPATLPLMATGLALLALFGWRINNQSFIAGTGHCPFPIAGWN